jgi:hypothetical protein
MNLVTTTLGQQLHQFCQDICSAYSTKDLLKEKAAHKWKKQHDQARNKNAPNADGSSLEATQLLSKSNKSGEFS